MPKQKLRALNLNARSFGLEARQGLHANGTAVEIARARGVDLTGHRTSSQESATISYGDLIVVMESGQARAVQSVAANRGAQITLLGLWCNPPRPAHLQDPFGLSDTYFETCFDVIDDAVERMAREISVERTR